MRVILEDYVGGKGPLEISASRETPLKIVYDAIRLAIRNGDIEFRRSPRAYNGRISDSGPYLHLLGLLPSVPADMPLGAVLSLELGVDKQRVKEMLDTMIRHGWVKRVGHGRYEATRKGREMLAE